MSEFWAGVGTGAIGILALSVALGFVLGPILARNSASYPVAESRPRKPPHVPPPAPRTEARKTIPEAVHRTCGRGPE